MLHKLSRIKALMLALIVVALGIGLAGCSSSSSSSNGKIKITATTDFYGEVAKKVAGNKGDVTSVITNPNVDPHDYQPSTKIAKETVGSKIVIANGIGYDGWMNNLVKDSSKVDYIKVGEDLMDKKNGDNPHLWYNPATMPKLANTIATKLGKLQPSCMPDESTSCRGSYNNQPDWYDQTHPDSGQRHHETRQSPCHHNRRRWALSDKFSKCGPCNRPHFPLRRRNCAYYGSQLVQIGQTGHCRDNRHPSRGTWCWQC